MGNWLFECKSSMDRGTKRKSIFVLVGFAVIITTTLLISRKFEENISVLVALGLLALYIAALVYGIKLAREFNMDDRKGIVKTFGVGGVGGNLGRFSTEMHKKLHAITSRDSNWTLIRMKSGKKYIISPDNIELINEVNKSIGRL